MPRFAHPSSRPFDNRPPSEPNHPFIRNASPAEQLRWAEPSRITDENIGRYILSVATNSDLELLHRAVASTFDSEII